MKITDIDGIPLFDTIAEAEYIASEIGCKGYHEHEYEGKTGYMPCFEHNEVLDSIQEKGQYLEDLMKDYKITYIREVNSPEKVSDKYVKKLASLNIDRDSFYRIVSTPNEPSILDLPFRRFRYIYIPGVGAPDLVERSRDFCVRMMTGKQLVFRYEDFLNLSAEIDAIDTDRKIIPRPRNSGPVDIWTWKGGAGCLHRILELWLEPRGYIYNNAREALIESEGNIPADGQPGQINQPPNYAGGFAKVGERGGITESKKAPKSDTPNPNPKGEGTAKGDASGKRGAKVTEAQEKTLQGKVDDFNEKESNTKNGRATLGALKSVFQRGLGAYNTSRSPAVKSAQQWAYARVNAFLYLLKNGRPENSKYTTDYDLLPKDHPKYSKEKKEDFDYVTSDLSPYASTTGDTQVEEFIDKKPFERKKDYLQRCMGSDKMIGEYSDEKQRYAVCVSDFESFSKKSGKVIIFDIDDTLIKNGKPILKTLEYLDSKKDDYRIMIVSARPTSRLEETKKELQDLEIYYDDIFLQDFAENTSGEVGKKFKEYKAKKLLQSGYEVVEAIENDEETLSVYESLGIQGIHPDDLDLSYTPEGFSDGYAVFADKETAMEYSEFCGCSGMIEEIQYMGKRMFRSCSTKKQNMGQAFSANEEKRIIYALVMVPNRLIPRVDEFGKKYFVQFKPSSVERMAHKYLKQKRTDQVNYEHTDQKLQDVYMVESWIVSSDNDKAYNYFTEEQAPIGTWVAGFKVDSDEVWNKYVKSGKVKGVSLQGNFLYIN